MALTANERTVLRLARESIQKGNDVDAFLCNHIYFVTTKSPHLGDAGRRLTEYIEKQLRGHITLEGWQRSRGLKHISKGRKQDRLDWIDWMMGLQ